MVTILRPFGEIVIKPFEVKHTSSEMNALISRIKNIQGESRMVMEATGHYYEPIAHALTQAGFYVAVVNPKLIKDFSNNSLRKVKSDKADSSKIARYTFDNWNNWDQYTHMDHLRAQLKLLKRQFHILYQRKDCLQKQLNIST